MFTWWAWQPHSFPSFGRFSFCHLLVFSPPMKGHCAERFWDSKAEGYPADSLELSLHDEITWGRFFGDSFCPVLDVTPSCTFMFLCHHNSAFTKSLTVCHPQPNFESELWKISLCRPHKPSRTGPWDARVRFVCVSLCLCEREHMGGRVKRALQCCSVMYVPWHELIIV